MKVLRQVQAWRNYNEMKLGCSTFDPEGGPGGRPHCGVMHNSCLDILHNGDHTRAHMCTHTHALTNLKQIHSLCSSVVQKPCVDSAEKSSLNQHEFPLQNHFWRPAIVIITGEYTPTHTHTQTCTCLYYSWTP